MSAVPYRRTFARLLSFLRPYKRGLVISTNPDVGSLQPPKTGVTLIVSKGPKPVVVPDVTGEPADQATAELEALGLLVNPSERYDAKVEQGKVISTSPSANFRAHQGDTIAIVVSKGPRLFPVPDVTGKHIDEAIKIIEKAGFHANARQIFPFGPDKVVRETPRDPQPKGATIELDYY